MNKPQQSTYAPFQMLPVVGYPLKNYLTIMSQIAGLAQKGEAALIVATAKLSAIKEEYMKQHSHQNRLSLLQQYVRKWLEHPRLSRSVIGEEVVRAFYELGYREVLAPEGIDFKYTDDVANDMRTRAQKLFRWLGHYDGIKASPDKLFFIEAAILAAMPQDLRLSYLNDVYAVTGVFIGVNHNQGDAISNEQIAAALTKENMEAQLSVIKLGSCPSEAAVHNAYRELKESAGTTLAAIEALEDEYPVLTNHQKEKSRQSCFARTGRAANQVSAINANGEQYEQFG